MINRNGNNKAMAALVPRHNYRSLSLQLHLQGLSTACQSDRVSAPELATGSRCHWPSWAVESDPMSGSESASALDDLPFDQMRHELRFGMARSV